MSIKPALFAPIACLAVLSACSGSDKVTRDDDGNIILAGTWECERVGGSEPGKQELESTFTFDEGTATLLQKAHSINGGLDVRGETRFEYSYAGRQGDMLSLLVRDIELIAISINGEELTGGDFIAAQAQMTRGELSTATFRLGETETGGLQINDRGRHVHECTRG